MFKQPGSGKFTFLLYVVLPFTMTLTALKHKKDKNSEQNETVFSEFTDRNHLDD